MNIDLTNLMTGVCDKLTIESDVNIPIDYFKNTTIEDLKDIKFQGNITKLYDDDFELSGTLTGIMVLPDDLTLEPVDYSFQSKFTEKISEITDFDEKKLQIIKNRLDITDFLCQNILVEIPLKVINEENKGITLKGNGWRLVTEEELANEKSNNSPFSELYNLIDSRKE